ncbi:MAG TPA: hypothetical protein VLN44_03200 [Pyrinomonadaceae bacterium]|nr:hypothetical protein [Pyrinomonadaceae bacterium]
MYQYPAGENLDKQMSGDQNPPMMFGRYSDIPLLALVCVFALQSAVFAQRFGHGRLSNPEGYWQLTAPTVASLSSFYNSSGNGQGLGEHKNGRLLLSTFPADAGNIVGVVPATVNIEYQATPLQVLLYLSGSDFIPVPLDSHGRGQVDVDTQSQAVTGYACTQTMKLSIFLEFNTDSSMQFNVLQKIGFVSTAGTGNCADYLTSVRTQLDAGTAMQPWVAFSGSGGLKAKKLETLREIDLTYEFTGSRLSSTTTLLPHCPAASPLLSMSPVDLSEVTGVVPLGNLNPTGHTFPAPHLYFYLKRTNPLDPLDFTFPSVSTALYAPANVRIYEVTRSEYSTGPLPGDHWLDYSIKYAVCRELTGYFGHVTTLSPAFETLIGAIGSTNCNTYSTGGVTITQCTNNVSVDVAAGFILGTAGGTLRANALDVGMRDQRVTLTYISPAKYPSDRLHTVCAVDYMEPGPKVAMESKLGNFSGTVLRTVPPVCGGVMYDIAGTASGDWFAVGASTDHEDPHLALVPDNVSPNFLTFSVGTSVPSLPPGTYVFLPGLVDSSFVNQPFSAVAPGAVYCYGPVSAAGLSRVIFLEMTDSTHLRIASVSGPAVTCGAAPFTMPAGAGMFER